MSGTEEPSKREAHFPALGTHRRSGNCRRTPAAGANLQNQPGPTKDQLFEVILDSATDFAIFSVDEDGLVTSWNAGAERLFGFTADEIIGKTGSAIFTEEDRDANVPELERATARTMGKALD